jgi:hypothetical protein
MIHWRAGLLKVTAIPSKYRPAGQYQTKDAERPAGRGPFTEASYLSTERIATGLEATLADFGTDPAAFVHPRRPGTLLAAHPTGVGASLDHLPEHGLVAAGAARRDRPRRYAEVGTCIGSGCR